jgi:hypothetical protein
LVGCARKRRCGRNGVGSPPRGPLTRALFEPTASAQDLPGSGDTRLRVSQCRLCWRGGVHWRSKTGRCEASRAFERICPTAAVVPAANAVARCSGQGRGPPQLPHLGSLLGKPRELPARCLPPRRPARGGSRAPGERHDGGLRRESRRRRLEICTDREDAAPARGGRSVDRTPGFMRPGRDARLRARKSGRIAPESRGRRMIVLGMVRVAPLSTGRS